MTPDQFTQSWDWPLPIPIHYGPGRLAELGALCRSRGLTNPLIVTDRGSAGLPFVARAMQVLASAGLGSGLFADVSPNPTDREAMAGRDVFRAGGHDGVIALGGGSGMDAGKAVSLVARNDRLLWDFDFDLAPPGNLTAADFPPLLCIPTTAGTGAETESTAMITDTARGIKGCVWHPLQKPFAALLDPELTLGLPRNLTGWTGCDALTHAIEAYIVPAANPLCDGAALEGLRLIASALPQVLADPQSIPARGAMLVGSCLAGIAFLKGLGLVHAISHMVGAECDTHHGLTNAVVLPVVLRYNESSIGHKLAPLSAAMGLETRDFAGLLAAVEGLIDLCAVPRGLADLGVRADQIPSIARKAVKDVAVTTNPRPADLAQIEALIRAAMTETRPLRNA